MKKKNVTLQCEEHPNFTGAKNPRTDCIVCWKIRASYLIAKIMQLEKRLK